MCPGCALSGSLPHFPQQVEHPLRDSGSLNIIQVSTERGELSKHEKPSVGSSEDEEWNLSTELVDAGESCNGGYSVAEGKCSSFYQCINNEKVQKL